MDYLGLDPVWDNLISARGLLYGGFGWSGPDDNPKPIEDPLKLENFKVHGRFPFGNFVSISAAGTKYVFLYTSSGRNSDEGSVSQSDTAGQAQNGQEECAKLWEALLRAQAIENTANSKINRFLSGNINMRASAELGVVGDAVDNLSDNLGLFQTGLALIGMNLPGPMGSIADGITIGASLLPMGSGMLHLTEGIQDANPYYDGIPNLAQGIAGMISPALSKAGLTGKIGAVVLGLGSYEIKSWSTISHNKIDVQFQNAGTASFRLSLRTQRAAIAQQQEIQNKMTEKGCD